MKKSNLVIFFSIALLLIGGMVVMAIYFLKKAEQDSYWIQHRRFIQERMDETMKNLLEMEATQRGFIITKNLQAYSAYSNAEVNLYDNILILDSLIGETVEQQENLMELRDLVKERVLALNRTKELALDTLNIRTKEINTYLLVGDDIMDEIRLKLKEMYDQEEQLLATRASYIENVKNNSVITLIIFSVVIFIVLLIMFIVLLSENKNKERAYTEIHDTLIELRESEEKYRNLNVNANDAVIISNDDGVITSWNPAAESTFGYSEEEAIGSLISIIVPDAYKEAHINGMKRYKSMGTGNLIGKRFEIIGLHKSGKEFPIEITLGHWILEGKKNIAATIRDISELKEKEQALNELLENLKRSNQELERFAYVASHDLQEPLRKIQSFGDRMLSKFEDAEIEFLGKDYAERMIDAAKRMQKLIEDLLTFSRVSRNTEETTAVDLNETIEEVIGDLNLKIKDKNAVIKIENKLPVIKKGRDTQLFQLFLNLINNALKFSKSDVQPNITISCKTIKKNEIEILKKSKLSSPVFYEIKITDNGIGFDMKYIEKIFTVFQRLHGRNEYEGTGIGLSVCQKICENHKGLISAHSELDIGSTFIIYLPKQ